jgi:hypothetical protein
LGRFGCIILHASPSFKTEYGISVYVRSEAYFAEHQDAEVAKELQKIGDQPGAVNERYEEAI